MTNTEHRTPRQFAQKMIDILRDHGDNLIQFQWFNPDTGHYCMQGCMVLDELGYNSAQYTAFVAENAVENTVVWSAAIFELADKWGIPLIVMQRLQKFNDADYAGSHRDSRANIKALTFMCEYVIQLDDWDKFDSPALDQFVFERLQNAG